MYQHTIRHQHQVLPSPKERGSPPPYPQRSHYIMARARSSHRSPAAPRDLSSPAEHALPPQQRTQDLSWCQRSTRTRPGRGCEPLLAATPISPASTGPHAASPLSLPRDGETLPGAASPPGPAVNSGHRHPRTSRRSTVTLPVPSGVGARVARRGTPPAPAVAAVTGEEMREDPRCSRRRRERGLRRKAPRGHHEKAENAGQTPPPPRPGGAGGSGRAATARRLPRAGQRPPRPLGTMRGHGGAEKAGLQRGFTGARLHRQSPAAAPAPTPALALHRPPASRARAPPGPP
ncbi:serine/arginine repetitive matrix protein 1-like [Onychostruthus taczanowskii]|uniref:serine/arginine repetitive matrix protein 1-like n=1 Tax=Onychostruthus taczanowskii TaxID=356909 RepID=UPI001B8015B9|nr:serine/arginine repetitive matrix protein 1-like [Onychostruthus taczanowskii]